MVDVRLQQENGTIYGTVSEGFIEISTHWICSREYHDWQYEMIWMTLYFSVAVWMSIYLINAPKLNQLKNNPVKGFPSRQSQCQG